MGTEQYKKNPPHFVERWLHPETGDEVFRYVSASQGEGDEDGEPDAHETAMEAVRSATG